MEVLEWQRATYVQRRRLDDVCCELCPEYSKNVIQSFIVDGKVYVDDRKVTKAGSPVKAGASVEVRAEVPRFVCRGGLKLESALDSFEVDVTGLTVLDSGLSTGGFTDCLLQRGASKVYGVDVGYGQVADKVRRDPRVVVMERTNLRYLTPDDLQARVDFATLDLSFISLTKVAPAVASLLRPCGRILALVKPQFEADPQHVSRGGVVNDPAVHEHVIDLVTNSFGALGFERAHLMESPIRGAKRANKEFLALFVHAQELRTPETVR